MHEIASYICNERAIDLISFPVDRELKSIILNVKNIENSSRITAGRLPKMIK